MRRTISLVIMLSLLMATPVFALEVKGYLHEKDGQRILHVWGDHYEMGFAQGYLLGSEITDMFQEYILSLLPKAIYDIIHYIGPPLFDLPDHYREELTGILEGMRVGGANMYQSKIGREMDLNDLIFANIIADIGSMACSSLVAWGPATQHDPDLLGETAMVRNLDWPLAGERRFLLPESTIVVVYSPSEPGTRTVASVTFPGFIGCLSCMNDTGVSVSLNIAHNGVGLFGIDYTKRFVPVEMTIRDALASSDPQTFNGNSIYHVVDEMDKYIRSGATVVNLAQPLDRDNANPGVIVESDNKGLVMRNPEDEAGFGDYVLGSTNYLTKLRPTKECWRLEAMREQVSDYGGVLDLQEMWDIEASVVQDWWLSYTMQTIYFIPHRREIGVSYSSENMYSTDKDPAVLTWADMTEMPDDYQDDDDDDDQDDDDDSGDDEYDAGISDNGVNCCGGD